MVGNLKGAADRLSPLPTPSLSLHPKYWGGATWRVLAGIAYGMSERNGEEQVSEYTVKVLVALGGVLPCSACRESYYNMVVDVLEPAARQEAAPPKLDPAEARLRAESLLGKLSCKDMPRFVFALHEKVNDKLDSAHFSRRLPILAKYLGVPDAELAQALQATRFCQGRRPTLDSVQSVHNMHTFKCTPEDAMSMLFMFAFTLPGGPVPDWSGTTGGGGDARRCADFYTFMGNLAEVMYESGCDGMFTETLNYTWETFERGSWSEMDTLYRDGSVNNVMAKVLEAKARGVMTHRDAFMLVWVVRARMARGFKSGLVEHAVDDAKSVFLRIYNAAFS